MGIHDGFRRQVYKLDYDCGNSGDMTAVWINEDAGMAVRIEWIVAEAKSSGTPSAALRGEVRAAQTREELAVVPPHVIHGQQPSPALGGELTESNKKHNVSANARL